MSAPQRLRALFRPRIALEQYSRRGTSSKPTSTNGLPSSLQPESETTVDSPDIWAHKDATQSTGPTSCLPSLEASFSIRKRYNLKIRKHFSGHECDSRDNRNCPGNGAQRLHKIETDLSCRRPVFKNGLRIGPSQLLTINAAKESKVITDSVLVKAAEQSQHGNFHEPGFPPNTTLGASPQMPKPDDRPADVAYWFRKMRDPGAPPLRVHKTMARTLHKAQRRPYTTSFRLFSASQNAELATPLKPDVSIPSRSFPIREHLRLWQEHQDKINTEYAMTEGLEKVISSKYSGVVSPKFRDKDDTTVISEDTEVSKSAEDAIVEEEDQVPNLFQDRPFFELGEIVELDTAKEPILAVFTGNIQDQMQFYTMNGQWVHRRANQVKFRVPHMIPVNALQEILPYLPKEGVSVDKVDQLHEMEHTVPRKAGAAIINQLLSFRAKSEALYRKYAEKLDNAHEVLAHPRHTKSVTLPEIAHLLLDEDDLKNTYYPSLWTVHKALSQNMAAFQLDTRNHRNTGRFSIRSKHDVKMINRVRQWTRDYQESLIFSATEEDQSHSRKHSKMCRRVPNHIASFIGKARSMLSKSRTTRDITQMGSLGPSSVKYGPIERNIDGFMWTELWHNVSKGSFTIEESDILRFLILHGSGHLGDKNTSRLASIGPMIVRATEMYDEIDLTQNTSWILCQELGIVKPWQNRTIFSHQLALPGHGFQNKTDYLKRAQQSVDTSSILEDSMKDLRKDWEDMEVFCIDSADAAEIDDGISLEPVDEAAGIYRVHIHVANPTAFIPTSNSIAKYAAHVGQTIYLPEGVYPMLEPSISQKYFSLASGRPTLTISAEMNMEGRVLDYTITPGRIHNVLYVSPLTVSQALSGQHDEIKRPDILTVGGTMPIKKAKAMHEKLTESQVDTLRKLSALGAAHCNRRSNASQRIRIGLTGKAGVSVSFHPPEIVYPQGRCEAFQIHGDPVIAMRPVPVDDSPTPPWDANSTPWDANSTLVADIMVLACNIAALWSKDRNLPLIYRGTTSTYDAPHRDEFTRAVILPAISQYGFIPKFLRKEYMRVLGTAAVSDQPISHDIIGTKAYTKVTSPLRRYGDMLAHWQIEAALLDEAKTGESLAHSQRSFNLPFSREKVQSVLPAIIDRERLIQTYQLFAERHWITQFMFRAFYFKEAPLPDTFKVTVQDEPLKDFKSDTYRCKSIINEFGVTCDLTITENSRQQGGLRLGDMWEAKIDHVDCWTHDVVMIPIRLIEKDVG